MNIQKNTSSTIPSQRSSILSLHMAHRTNAAPSDNSMSRCRIMPRGIRIGFINAEQPTIISVLKILLPTILPTLMSPLSCTALKKLTTNSGRLVPIATTVRPITISDIFQRRAIALAESINLSAPHSTIAVPTISRTISNNIFSI